MRPLFFLAHVNEKHFLISDVNENVQVMKKMGFLGSKRMGNGCNRSMSPYPPQICYLTKACLPRQQPVNKCVLNKHILNNGVLWLKTTLSFFFVCVACNVLYCHLVIFPCLEYNVWVWERHVTAEPFDELRKTFRWLQIELHLLDKPF